jgi:hypothetical protein
MKDLKETTSGDHLIIIASKMTEAGTTGHTTIVCLLMEIAPIGLVRTITGMEETGDITTMEVVEAMASSIVMEVIIIIIVPRMVITVLRITMQAIMTVPTEMTNNALTIVRASKDMTISRLKLIPLLLQEKLCQAKD